MKYLKCFKTEEQWEEIDYDRALWTVLGTYKDNDATRAMLTIGNLIPCRFSDIRVYDDNGLTAMPGLYNLLPDGVTWPEN